jgi:hypothetical protein
MSVLDRGIGLRVGPRSTRVAIGPVTVDPLDWNLARVVGFPGGSPGRERAWNLLGYDLDAYHADLTGLRGAIGLSARAVALGDGETAEERARIREARAVLALETIERFAGRAVIDALGLLARGAAEDEGRSDLLVRTLRQAMGAGDEARATETERFVAELARSEGIVDFAIDRVEIVPVPEPAGFEAREKPGGATSRLGSRGVGGGVTWLSRVVVRQRGRASLPVVVHFRFEDGTELRKHWDGRAASEEFLFEMEVPLAAVEIDPDRLYAVDLDPRNNGWTSPPQCRSVTKVSGTLLFWIQNFLQALSSVS